MLHRHAAHPAARCARRGRSGAVARRGRRATRAPPERAHRVPGAPQISGASSASSAGSGGAARRVRPRTGLTQKVYLRPLHPGLRDGVGGACEVVGRASDPPHRRDRYSCLFAAGIAARRGTPRPIRSDVVARQSLPRSMSTRRTRAGGTRAADLTDSKPGEYRLGRWCRLNRGGSVARSRGFSARNEATRPGRSPSGSRCCESRALLGSGPGRPAGPRSSRRRRSSRTRGCVTLPISSRSRARAILAGRRLSFCTHRSIVPLPSGAPLAPGSAPLTAPSSSPVRVNCTW